MAYDKDSNIGKFQATQGKDEKKSFDINNQPKSIDIAQAKPVSIDIVQTKPMSVNIPLSISGFDLDLEEKSIDIPSGRVNSIDIPSGRTNSMNILGSRANSLNISQKKQLINFLNLENIGHDAEFYGDIGSILKATNCNVSDSTGLIDTMDTVSISEQTNETMIEGGTFYKGLEKPLTYVAINSFGNKGLAVEALRALEVEIKPYHPGIISGYSESTGNRYVGFPIIPSVLNYKIQKASGGTDYLLVLYGQIPAYTGRINGDDTSASVEETALAWQEASSTPMYQYSNMMKMVGFDGDFTSQSGTTSINRASSIRFSFSSVDGSPIITSQFSAKIKFVAATNGNTTIVKTVSGNHEDWIPLEGYGATQPYWSNGFIIEIYRDDGTETVSRLYATNTKWQFRSASQRRDQYYQNSYILSPNTGAVPFFNSEFSLREVSGLRFDPYADSSFDNVRIDVSFKNRHGNEQGSLWFQKFSEASQDINTVEKSIYMTEAEVSEEDSVSTMGSGSSRVLYEDSLHVPVVFVNQDISPRLSVKFSKQFLTSHISTDPDIEAGYLLVQPNSSVDVGHSGTTGSFKTWTRNVVIHRTSEPEYCQNIKTILSISADTDLGLAQYGEGYKFVFINRNESDILKYVVPKNQESFNVSDIKAINTISVSDDFISIVVVLGSIQYYMFEKKIYSYKAMNMATTDQFKQNYVSDFINTSSLAKSSAVSEVGSEATEAVSIYSFNEDIIKSDNIGLSLVKSEEAYSIAVSGNSSLSEIILNALSVDDYFYPSITIPAPYSRMQFLMNNPFYEAGEDHTMDTTVFNVNKIFSILRLGFVNTQMDEGLIGICFIPARDSVGQYTVLPERIRDFFDIQYPLSSARAVGYPAIIGQTEVCVGKNIYMKSRLGLVPQTNTPMLPENGDIYVYSGLIFVSNENSCSIYTVTELGFQYLTSVPERLISNVVSISGNIIFYAQRGIWVFNRESGLKKMCVTTGNDTAVIRTLDGKAFIACRANNYGTVFETTDGEFETTDGVFETSYTALVIKEINSRLQVGHIDYESSYLFDFFKTSAVQHEGIIALSSTGLILDFERDTNNSTKVINFKHVSFVNTDIMGFIVESAIVIVKASAAETNNIVIDINGDSDTYSATYVTGVNRFIIPLMREMAEASVSLTIPNKCSLVGFKLSGYFIKDMEV